MPDLPAATLGATPVADLRATLADLVRQTKDLFDVVKVTGTEAGTRVQAVDKDRTLLVEAALPALPDLGGVFGIGNLALLDGLLAFPTYRDEGASFGARREVKQGAETVTAFVFRDAHGQGAVFRTMASRLVAAQAEIEDIPWAVAVAPSRSKVAEFAQLSRLYSGVDKAFRIRMEGGALVFAIGDAQASTHSASMVFATEPQGDARGGDARGSGIEGRLGERDGDVQFDTGQFLSLVRLAGPHPAQVKVASGLLGVEVELPTGRYDYFLRAQAEPR